MARNVWALKPLFQSQCATHRMPSPPTQKVPRNFIEPKAGVARNHYPSVSATGQSFSILLASFESKETLLQEVSDQGAEVLGHVLRQGRYAGGVLQRSKHASGPLDPKNRFHLDLDLQTHQKSKHQ